MLPKGTLAPNSGNISSNMRMSQIIQSQNKYCGKSGVVYVTGSTGNTGNTGFTGPTGNYSDVPELTATIGVRTPLLTTNGPTGLNIGTNTATSINIGIPNITTTINGNINIGTNSVDTNSITIGTVGKSTINLHGPSVNVASSETNGNINIGHKGNSVSNQTVKINTGTGATGTTTIGSTTSDTTINGKLLVNGNLTIGSTGTIFTTLGQQIRLGYANTQSSGTTGSSFGPFFKSFGPATVPANVSSGTTTYDISFDGPNGLFTPTGLDGVGGLLTIVLKATSLKMATLTYNVMKLNAYTSSQSLTVISNVFGGWTINPTISQGTGTNIKITFVTADVPATVSWMFMGAI